MSQEPSAPSATAERPEDALLERVETIEDVPLDERPALFAAANDVVVAALNELEEV